MLERTAILLFFTCRVKAGSLSDDSWKNLAHLIKQSSYTVAMRDGSCITGHVESFNDNHITIESRSVDRKDVARIGETIEAHDPIYSGRSSWLDLQEAHPNEYESVKFELKNHRTRNCHRFSASEVEGTCDGVTIRKSDVVHAFYIRLAPATRWEDHMAHENVGFLAPRTWFGYALFPRVKVLIYDEAMPQEAAVIRCKAQ